MSIIFVSEEKECDLIMIVRTPFYSSIGFIVNGQKVDYLFMCEHDDRIDFSSISDCLLSTEEIE